MSDYVLSCESALDLTAEHAASRNISYVSFSFELDGRTYRDDLWQTMSSAEFYRAMAEGAETRTSQINAADVKELYRWTEENKLRIHHWFFSTDLTYYIRGGRISRAAGTFGGLLGICPLLNAGADGRLVPREKIRSKKKVIQALAEKMVLYAEDGAGYDQNCYLRHSACEEDARQAAELVEAWFPKLKGRVEIHSIGPTIGSHTGPGTVALFFWGSPRTD